MSLWDLLQQLYQDVTWLSCMVSTPSAERCDFVDYSDHCINLFFFGNAGSCFRSCHTAGRDVFNSFLGNQGYKFVALGNLFCSRLALALILCFARGIRFVVEQPEGSSLPMHPRFQQVLAIGRAPWLNYVYCILADISVHGGALLLLHCWMNS